MNAPPKVDKHRYIVKTREAVITRYQESQTNRKIVHRKSRRRSGGAEANVRHPTWHNLPIHHRLRTKGPISRFEAVLVSIGGKRTLEGSTLHLMCSPFGTSGSCIKRVGKRFCDHKGEELTLEART